MLILGLGSNLGDRLDYLRQTLQLIKQIPALEVKQVSPLYLSDALLPPDSPSSWDKPFLNLALRCETKLLPNELLTHTKKIEKMVGSQNEKNGGPRVVDIDILAWGELVQYDERLHVPHEELLARPFALWPLADVAPHWIYPIPGKEQGKTAAELVKKWGSRFSGQAPLQTRQISHRVDTPRLVGIVNITPNSFSDGGHFFDTELALNQIQQLVNEGAEVIDIGAEATGPHAVPISPEEEWQRLEPLLDKLTQIKQSMEIEPKISIDTRHAMNAERALGYKVDWINDVSGLDDQSMRKVLKHHSCRVIYMHHLGVPTNPNKTLASNKNPFTEVYAWAEQRMKVLESEGIQSSRLIFDIGIGYGKTPEQSLSLIKEASQFKKLGIEIMVGHSRKSFLANVTDKPAGERDIETLVTSLSFDDQPDVYLRVHNVEMHARAFKMKSFLKG